MELDACCRPHTVDYMLQTTRCDDYMEQPLSTTNPSAGAEEEHYIRLIRTVELGTRLDKKDVSRSVVILGHGSSVINSH